MKTLNFLCFFCFFVHVSCDKGFNRSEAIQTEKPAPEEVVRTLTPVSEAVHDFQKVYCMLIMGDNFEEIAANGDFLTSQGLPDAIDHIPSTPDWRSFEQKFVEKPLKGCSPAQKKLYDQAVCIHLLRNHALLAEADQKERIALYVKKYMNAGGASAGLVYHGLKNAGDAIARSEIAAYLPLLKERGARVWSDFLEQKKYFKKPAQQTEEVYQKIVAVMDDAYKSEHHYLELLERNIVGK
jgi:hypothetical protein